MNQIDAARAGRITDEVMIIAEKEGKDARFIVEQVKTGKIVIPINKARRGRYALGIGEGLKTKVNANLGTSPDDFDLDRELEKLRVAIEAGCDTVMDLSTGGDLVKIRSAILENSTVPVGTVPIYEAAVRVVRSKRSIVEMTEDQMFETIEDHLRSGVDFITVHCGVTTAALRHLKEIGRLTDVVSRGGSILLEWMYYNQKENPLHARYDDLLEIARTYDATLSLGDGLRPGSLADATDLLQVGEMVVIAELVERARKAGVQVMVEGPGHVPLQDIEANVLLEKKMCKGAPFYVLGPLVSDVTAGYDHITGAIGGALAAAVGADFLCYVTPSEHLRLPDANDVRDGVIAARIAAHVGDIAKGIQQAIDWDRKMSEARKKLDWDAMLKLALDPERAKRMRETSKPKDTALCTMCGEYCAMKKIKSVLKSGKEVGPFWKGQ
ncbi:MAG: phosphomethylpyrimidine synthase ThiC [bacterium]